MGTPQELTDNEGKLLWSADYKAWGEATVKRTPSGMSQNIENNHRFQGQYFDKETGLHYNRFRYYDPHMARYISKDPIGLEGGINTSAYVADPTQWIDPLGLNGKNGNNAGIGVLKTGRQQQASNILTNANNNLNQKIQNAVNRPKQYTQQGSLPWGAVLAPHTVGPFLKNDSSRQQMKQFAKVSTGTRATAIGTAYGAIGTATLGATGTGVATSRDGTVVLSNMGKQATKVKDAVVNTAVRLDAPKNVAYAGGAYGAISGGCWRL